MNSPSPLFIDTTSVIDIILKKDSYPEIEKLLNSHDKIIVAHYVKMEIKKGFLQYYVYLHNKIVNAKEWSEVEEAVSNLSATRHKHLLGSVLEAQALFWKSIQKKTPQEIKNEYGEILLSDYLRRKSASAIRVWIRALWQGIDKLASEIINPMNCYIDIEPPFLKGEMLINRRRTCDKSEIECKIKSFFRENKTDFIAILASLSEIPISETDDETKKRIRSLREILRLLHTARRFSNHTPNCKDCWNCSDAILAVMAPSGSDVLNHNPKHYNPICGAIGKAVLSYSKSK